jgi:DNA-binding PadR family transcriptional regulator
MSVSEDPVDPCQERGQVTDGDDEPGRTADGRGRQLLLEAAVLVALAEHKSAHGYDIRRIIADLTDGFMQVDSANLYRLLRRLETEGLVTSTWVEGEYGPQRRQYRLTREGCRHLDALRKPLENRERAFRAVLEAIGRSG